MKCLSLARMVLNVPLCELIQRSLAGQVEYDSLITLPGDYVPSGHRCLGQIGGPLSLAALSMLRALGPYANRFEAEIALLASRSAPEARVLPAVLAKGKVEERSSALRTLLAAATLLQYPTVAGATHHFVEGAIMVPEDESLKPLWNDGESGIEACWKAFLCAVAGNYENAEAISRFQGVDYCCGERHETQNPDLCFDANSNLVTRSLLHFWAFALQEKKCYESPTDEAQFRAWKMNKTGADITRFKRCARALDTFVRLGNQFFFAAVHDVHPSIRCSDGRELVVLRDHMVVQSPGGDLRDLLLGDPFGDLSGRVFIRVVRQ